MISFTDLQGTKDKKDITLDQAIKLSKHKNAWIDMAGETRVNVSKFVKVIFPDFHELIVEDIFEDNRPKIDFHENYIVMHFKNAPDGNKSSQIAVFMNKYNIITIHEASFNVSYLFEYFKKQTKVSKGFALFKILSRLSNMYFEWSDKKENEITKLEYQNLKNISTDTITQIMKYKNQLFKFKRILTYERDILIALTREELPQLSKRERVFLRDIYDDIVLLIDLNETMHEILSGNVEIYVANIGNKTNLIVKTLTLVTAFAVFPTFIASLYGMNFKYMPELSWMWGYPFALGIMLLSCIVGYVIFKKKGWF